jgi:hypothetical protein
MWSGLLAANIVGWLHQLTATHRDGRLIGHGVRGGQAMIATCGTACSRFPPAWSTTPAPSPCAYRPASTSLPRSSPASAPFPNRTDPATPGPDDHRSTLPRRNETRFTGMPAHQTKVTSRGSRSAQRL